MPDQNEPVAAETPEPRPLPPGRFGMSPAATATFDALGEARHSAELASAPLLGAAQGTAPPDRWQSCADYIDRTRQHLDQAAAMLVLARPADDEAGA